MQSVATRIVVERERERMAFRRRPTGTSTGELDAGRRAEPTATFAARLVAVDGERVATGRDFDSLGALKASADVVHLDEAAASALADRAARRAARGPLGRGRSPYTPPPYAPFMTSTLQQEAGRKLRFRRSRR